MSSLWSNRSLHSTVSDQRRSAIHAQACQDGDRHSDERARAGAARGWRHCARGLSRHADQWQARRVQAQRGRLQGGARQRRRRPNRRRSRARVSRLSDRQQGVGRCSVFAVLRSAFLRRMHSQLTIEKAALCRVRHRRHDARSDRAR